MGGSKYALMAAGAAMVAVLAAAPFTNIPIASMAAKAPDVLSILHKRSPEVRQSGALTNKKAAVSMKLPAAVQSARAPVAPPFAAPAPAPVATALPAAPAPVAVPSAIMPAAAPAVLAAVPTAPGGGFVIPLVVPIGGGGGGGPAVIVNPGNPPAPVPPIPEPETWAMMIVGFGLLGAFLRRRRRSSSELRLTQLSGAPALQTGAR